VTPAGLLALDATRLGRRIAAREVSCRELMQASLDRIAALNPVHNAIVSLRGRAELLAEADAHDAVLARGEFTGWMHGFPVAVKDLSDVQGLPTTRARRPWACASRPPTRCSCSA
jgi:amidase